MLFAIIIISYLYTTQPPQLPLSHGLVIATDTKQSYANARVRLTTVIFE